MTSCEPPERMTLTRAITLLSWHFLHGEALTTMEVARMTGRSRSGAYRLLCEMSGAMPLVQDDECRWQLESMLEPE
jgi:DNA-binding IclR family transcriptional regulator